MRMMKRMVRRRKRMVVVMVVVMAIMGTERLMSAVAPWARL